VYQELTQGIRVEVDPEYLPEYSSPQTREFIFSYHVTITNTGDTEVKLISRHWIITDGLGVVQEVKGPGVVGEQPVLQPGQKHSYSSFCPLPTPTGNMQGSFQMVNELGNEFDVKIPVFYLTTDQTLH
jgi:ApaG protein